MAWAVVSVASNALPVTETTNGIPVTRVSSNGYPVVFVSSGGLPVTSDYDTSAMTFFDAMPTPLTTAEKSAVNTFIVGLKTDSLWSKIDGGNIFCLGTAEQCYRDFKVPSRVATVYSVPTFTFTANRQFMSDGNTDTVNLPASINTGWNPATAGGNYTDDSGHMAVWRIQTGGTTSTRNFCGVNAANDLLIQGRSTGDTVVARINTPASDTYLSGSTNGNGFFMVSRVGDTSSYGQMGSTQGADIATQSTGMPNGTLRALQIAGSSAPLGTEGISFLSYGGGFSKAEGLLFNLRVQTLVTALRAI